MTDRSGKPAGRSRSARTRRSAFFPAWEHLTRLESSDEAARVQAALRIKALFQLAHHGKRAGRWAPGIELAAHRAGGRVHHQRTARPSCGRACAVQGGDDLARRGWISREEAD